jgi:hypothetical protein
MTDFCLSSADQATMYEAFKATGIMDEEGNIQTQGLFDDGTDWCLLDWGARTWNVQTGIDPKTEMPVVVIETDGLYWCVLRWNGDHPLPADQPGVTVAWASNDEDAPEYPQGLPRFA